MKIIGTTEQGFLISATEDEVRQICAATVGEIKGKIETGLKLPALDYAQTVRKLKRLSSNYSLKQAEDNMMKFFEHFGELKAELDLLKNLNDQKE